MRVRCGQDLGLPGRWPKGEGTSQLPAEADATRSCCLKNSRGLSGRWAIMAAASWGHKEGIRARPRQPPLDSPALSSLALTSTSDSDFFIWVSSSSSCWSPWKPKAVSWAPPPPPECLLPQSRVFLHNLAGRARRWHLRPLTTVAQQLLAIHKALSQVPRPQPGQGPGHPAQHLLLLHPRAVQAPSLLHSQLFSNLLPQHPANRAPFTAAWVSVAGDCCFLTATPAPWLAHIPRPK